MTRSYTIEDLARLVEGTLRSRNAVRITGVADLDEAGPSDASWATRPEYESRIGNCSAGVVLVKENFGPAPMPVILCRHVERSVALLLGAFAPVAPDLKPGVHPTAIVQSDARIAPNASVGPHVVVEAGAGVGSRSVLHAGAYLGRGSSIGEDCVVWPNVVIHDQCLVGNRVMIHSNTVIGADGFGFYFLDGRHHKVPHIGGVIIEDDVEIGACTCIDRAKFGNTIVGRGTKIDNHVQIAHNVRVGAHTLMAGHTGISGSVRVGEYAVFGARAGSLDNLSIGKGARVAAISVVSKDVGDGQTVSGFPAQDHRAELRERAALRRLPEFAEQVKELKKRVHELEASMHHRA